VLHHLERVRGPADAAHTPRAERGLEQGGGRRTVRRHEALGERDDPGTVGHPEPFELLDGSADSVGGNREEDQVRARELVRLGTERAHVQVTRQLDAGEVVLVLARTRELLRLLRSAAEQRRANAGPLEQHSHRGAERPGPDDGGAAWMLAGVADGRTSYRRSLRR
jgi:hypothetical protein